MRKESPARPLIATWRVGRKVGRTIYAQAGREPSDDDELIGVMDTPSLARAAVTAANGDARLREEIERLQAVLAENPEMAEREIGALERNTESWQTRFYKDLSVVERLRDACRYGSRRWRTFDEVRSALLAEFSNASNTDKDT